MVNLALLCRRHHTYVHRHRLTATVTPHGVTWHPGSSGDATALEQTQGPATRDPAGRPTG